MDIKAIAKQVCEDLHSVNDFAEEVEYGEYVVGRDGSAAIEINIYDLDTAEIDRNYELVLKIVEVGK